MHTENVCLLACSLEWWTIYNGFTPARQPANLLGVRAAAPGKATIDQPGAQQQTCSSGVRRSNNGTDRQTDGRLAVS